MPRRRTKAEMLTDAQLRVGSTFRHSKAARTTSFAWLHGLTEKTAYEFFKKVRFAENGGVPFCPACGSTKFYDIKKRPGLWKCAKPLCAKQFSVTSGTIFHSRKLSFLKIVKLVHQFADCAKGEPALRLSLPFESDVKTVWVNLMKMREALSARRDEVFLAGEVEMDAVWIGGKARKHNNAVKQRERAAAETAGSGEAAYRRGKRAVMVLRQRGGESVMFATNSEAPDVAAAAIQAVTLPGTVVITDQSPAYARIGDIRAHQSVNHSVSFKEDGVTSNLAESSFSRVRRAHYGTHHYLSVTYLDWYAGELCWREDRRRQGNKEQAAEILTRCLTHGQSRHLKGYWQNYLLPDDQLERPEMRWGRVHDRMVPRPPDRNALPSRPQRPTFKRPKVKKTEEGEEKEKPTATEDGPVQVQGSDQSPGFQIPPPPTGGDD